METEEEYAHQGSCVLGHVRGEFQVELHLSGLTSVPRGPLTICVGGPHPIYFINHVDLKDKNEPPCRMLLATRGFTCKRMMVVLVAYFV